MAARCRLSESLSTPTLHADDVRRYAIALVLSRQKGRILKRRILSPVAGRSHFRRARPTDGRGHSADGLDGGDDAAGMARYRSPHVRSSRRYPPALPSSTKSMTKSSPTR
jgi:hypothetical protein